MQKDLLSERDNFIGLRVSTADRMKVDRLGIKLGIKNQSEIIRRLINDTALELGLGLER